MKTLVLLLGVALWQASAPKKIDIVSVTGCLKEAPTHTWTLTSATDPVPSLANAPPAKEIPTTPPAGKNAFALIGGHAARRVRAGRLSDHRDAA